MGWIADAISIFFLTINKYFPSILNIPQALDALNMLTDTF